MLSLRAVIAALRKKYGTPKPPALTDPWHQVLAESASYLVDDHRRLRVFRSLKARIGLRPEQILDAPQADLIKAIDGGGMQPSMRAGKLRKCARLSLDFFSGDLTGTLATLPLSKARRAVKRFPGIGEPGADKVLLFAKLHPSLPLESNGLRVMLRLGFGTESGGYAASYRSVQEAIEGQHPSGFGALIEVHQLLRRHGQELCTRSSPDCPACPLRRGCPSARNEPVARL